MESERRCIDLLKYFGTIGTGATSVGIDSVSDNSQPSKSNQSNFDISGPYSTGKLV